MKRMVRFLLFSMAAVHVEVHDPTYNWFTALIYMFCSGARAESLPLATNLNAVWCAHKLYHD